MGKQMKLEDLTKGNIWSISETELNQMLLNGRKSEDWADNEVHYMNIIRPVFDIQYFNRTDEDKVKALEAQQFEIFSSPNAGEFNAIAIRKHRINHVDDLTLENVIHLLPEEVLSLLEKNMGTGWQGLPLAIQDIIESAFYVDCAVLPEYAMHRAGGIIDRRKADGYEVLEVPRGNWIEAVFMKTKPKMEKPHFSSPNYNYDEDHGDEEDDDDEDDDDEEDDDDLDDKDTQDEDDDEMDIDEENPDIEEVDIIDEDEIDEEEEE